MSSTNKEVLALDLGTVTGFAHYTKHGITHGTIKMKVDGKWNDAWYERFEKWLEGFNTYNLEVVVEKGHVGKFLAAIRILFGLRAIVCLFCNRHSIQLVEVSPLTIKKFWTGTGKASKEQMVAQTQKKFPQVKDHNQSDAIALLHWYLENK